MKRLFLSAAILAAATTTATAQSCRQSAGAAQAQAIAHQCSQVSQMSSPPCNVENTCAMMVEEIDRGCDTLLKEMPGRAPSFCRSRHAAPVSSNEVTATGLAHYACPPAAGGKRLLNWSMVDSRSAGGVPSDADRGQGTINWSLTRAQSAQGSVLISCGYDGTGQKVYVQIARGITHCQNPEMTHEYLCDSK